MSINFLADFPTRWGHRIQRARFEVGLGCVLFIFCTAALWFQMPRALSASEQTELSKLTALHAQPKPPAHGLDPIYALLNWQVSHPFLSSQITSIEMSSTQLKLTATLNSANEFTQLINAFALDQWQIHSQTLEHQDNQIWLAEFKLQPPQNGPD
ncbi:hypothetical protein [Aliidiomarina sanyensis]|uniref:Uncharacterized protein n=1 Tax=Aliidiomarina sanyensis TaxID=1249555 RepID=A0A432WG24_9GAMM|nr:hypothetical protein [Aliidiomarina sanyensis]RUO32695.1 hypothetical protein CWE11_07930 [Aliidiomarina sanyensis]